MGDFVPPGPAAVPESLGARPPAAGGAAHRARLAGRVDRGAGRGPRFPPQGRRLHPGRAGRVDRVQARGGDRPGAAAAAPLGVLPLLRRIGSQGRNRTPGTALRGPIPPGYAASAQTPSWRRRKGPPDGMKRRPELEDPVHTGPGTGTRLAGAAGYEAARAVAPVHVQVRVARPARQDVRAFKCTEVSSACDPVHTGPGTGTRLAGAAGYEAAGAVSLVQVQLRVA